MAMDVVATGDPSEVLELASAFLEQEPARHNLVLTLLHARVRSPEPGRYWVAREDGCARAVLFQSPLTYVAIMTPAGDQTVDALVAAVAEAGILLPGVSGEAAPAARFAGVWTERHASGARPETGQRLYEVADVRPPVGVPGRPRPAVEDDAPLLASWMRAFADEIGEQVADPEGYVAARTSAGRLWVWDDDGLTSLATISPPVAGAARIQAVYTPPRHRRRGYASACVARLSSDTLEAGRRCLLYTDLRNQTSNAVYRRLGYEAVAEILRYRFD